MNEPKYKPNQWVQYQLEEHTAGFGQVVGAINNDGIWKYHVKGATTNDDNIQVPEDTVTFVLENGNWTSPQHFSGSESAYANTTPGV